MINILLHNITDINTLEKAVLEIARQIMEKVIEILELQASGGSTG